MTERCYPDWIRAYLEFTSNSEAPTQFHFWTAISTIAGALRRKVWIDMGHFEWTPNFYIIFCAKPGIAAKSTTASIGMNLLSQVEGIHIGPSAASWQALIRHMRDECQETFPMNGHGMPGYMQEQFQMTPITIALNELGTFYDPRDRTQTDILVDLWDGKKGRWRKITKMAGDDELVSPWINMIGCTTPSWVAENMTDYFHGGGMSSRAIFVYGEQKRNLVAYPKHAGKGLGLEEREAMLVEDLKQIAGIVGEYDLSPEAISWGEEWYHSHYKTDDHSHLGEKFAGYLARKQTHLHKLAMVLAASKRNLSAITRDDLKESLRFINKMEQDMPKVFGNMYQEGEVPIQTDLSEGLRKTGEWVRKSEYFRDHFQTRLTWGTYAKLLDGLITGGIVEQQQRDNQLFIRYRPMKKEKRDGADS